jgi:5'-nucleotidase
MDPENIALFDMDGTLCDHNLPLAKDLKKLQGPSEKDYSSIHTDHVPDYIKARADLIRSSKEWWANLPKFKLGWDILKIARKLGFKIMILTQGPKDKPEAWSGKMIWLQKNLPNIDVTMTRDKGLVYGKLLVDDYPPYIERWLENRPRGLVIMPAHEQNKHFSHPNVIRYNGKNIKEVKKVLEIVKQRKHNQPLILS